MKEEHIALGIIAGWLVLTSIYGLYVTRKGFRGGKVEEWFVAGRKLGLLVLWLSLGANIYSSYTFLGLPGFAARAGISVWAITIYGMIAYIIGFWLIPRLWSSAKERGWLTIADAFEDLYNSRLVGGFVALTGALWSIPYVQLQLQGMGYIIEVSGYGGVDPVLAKIIAFLILAVFVVVGGLVSVAGINALQGAIMLVALWGIGLAAPIVAFGGYDKLFNVLTDYASSGRAQGFHLYPTMSDLYFLYSIILVAPLAFWLWPNRVQNIYGARDVETVKKNMVLVGIYQLGQIPAILVGLTAVGLYATGVLGLPIHEKSVADKSFMLVTRQLFSPWVVGIVGAAALAASLSTAAAILHVSGALFARNVVPSGRGRLVIYARLFTGMIALISLYLALFMPDVLIYLLLVGYAGIAQFFPEYIIALKKPGLIGKYLAVVAMASGMASVGIVKALWGRPFNVYEGAWGMLVNLLVLSIGIALKKWRERR